MSFSDEPLLIFDGAYGSALSGMDLPEAAWDGCAGCTEVLNLTSPDAVRGLHAAYLDAGAMALETNTFGGSRIVLGEYGLGDRVADINAAAVRIARAAISGRAGRYVVGSVGPTTKLPSLGHVSRDEMYAAMREQVDALVGAGVDAVLVETCQDMWQAKIAVVAAFDVLAARGADVPVMLSVTLEAAGSMLVGSSIDAVVATFAPFPLFSLGLNCALGPAQMAPHVARLSATWPGRVSVMPNAGLPEVRAGRTFYPLAPDELARHHARFVSELGASIVGGCCGTGPEHVRAVAGAVRGLVPAPRDVRRAPSLSSLYAAVEIAQEPKPLVIGERMNAHGSRKFKKLLLDGAFDEAARLGPEQERRGAHALDLCVAFAGRDERADALAMIVRLNGTARAPIVVDSTRPEVVEAALEAIPGRCLVNSINLEDGGATAGRVLAAARRHGAAVIALTIDREGMAMTAARKVAVARELVALAGRHGLAASDLFIDALTFTLGSGDATLERAAVETLEAIRRIKAEIPGVHTSLGVSNCSFGLPAQARPFLNSIFLHEAIKAGLDAAIVDAGSIVTVARIDSADRRVCEDLILDRRGTDAASPLTALLDRFGARAAGAGERGEGARRERPEDALTSKVLDGDKADLPDLLDGLRVRHDPIDIINKVLVPAMRKVGELFGRGEMLLPFVLKSAEVVKESVRYLEPFMERAAGAAKVRVLLATVQGDVHDIGKNLVDIILTNNGYDVVNLGINVPAEVIIERAREHRVDAIGLSGLLVKSALEMSQSLARYGEAGLGVPILLGGAALSARFVADECVPRYDRPVVFCADAFAGLTAMQELERGTLVSTSVAPPAARSRAREGRAEPAPARAALDRSNPVPTPPFLGPRHVEEIDPALLFPLINREILYRGRWGFRRGKLAEAEHRALIAERADPLFAELEARLLLEGLVEPKVAYGWFPCRAEGDRLVVVHGGAELALDFPRQSFAPHLCIADYFKTAAEGGDVVGVFVGTIGDRALAEARRLYGADAYHDYLMVHGLAVELADALAELWHERMRAEVGGRGQRYGIGYPACPDLAMQRTVFTLVEPGRIGVALTDALEMVPETTTSAIVVHHPAADYFSI
ncbi:MAG: homocysteine S-methyltransferase family protein [Proteobacteria bacterium]|jgi:5-methyltetrahydrofolate--homocysteine methyltransferase|nr:homocysteine S-methyltransferase family protein [Pseudomonadota bacterium]